MVRLLWDPALVDRVYAGAPVPGLDAEGRAHLTRVDRRAWGTDPYRRARTLQALIEEYPCSVAEIGAAGTDAFFGDAAFHGAIAERGSLADAFGGWLAPRAGPTVAIERALAGLRRAPPAQVPAGRIRRGAVIPLEVPLGTLTRWEHVAGALGPDPLARLLAGWRPAPPPANFPASEHLLVQLVDGHGTVAGGSDGIHAILVKAARPEPREVLRRVAVRLGASRADADVILDDLLADGLLVSAPSHAAPLPGPR